MRVHHLIGARFTVPGVGEFISHVLLVESPDGLVVVDSGYGRDAAANLGRFGPMAVKAMRLDPDPATTAAGGVERLGFDPAEVKHVVLTHLDADHVGGVVDFPEAVVHTTAKEWHAAMASKSPLDRARYMPHQWRNVREMRQHEGPGESWRHGLGGHHIAEGVTLVPLAGHTLGHAAVAVEGANGLVVHAGDAVFDSSTIKAEVDGVRLPAKRRMRVFERLLARQPLTISRNHGILTELNADADVTVISAHDARQFPN